MINFIGGPASGEELMLRRAPLYLRVVVGRRGKLDALDQIDDQANSTEKIYVYRRIGEATRYHLKSSCRSMSGYWPRAEYGYVEPQPGDDQVRDNNAWQAWAMAQGAIA